MSMNPLAEDANVVPITKALASVVREYVARSVNGLALRLTALEQHIKEIPAGLPGEKGLPGATGQRGPQGEKGETGERGPQGEPGANGQDGRAGEPGPVGTPGERGEPGQPGKDGAQGLNGKDGVPGRDALELDILPAIDERKMYPRGIYATHCGGLWRTHKTSNGMDGWECIVQGINGIEFKQIDARNFEVNVQMSVATRTFKFAVPSVLERGVFKTGESYAQGDGVTFAGAYWIAQRDTTDRPGEGNDSWRLAVKSGRNGKDGDRGPQGPEGKPGRNGQDLRREQF